VIEKGRPAIRFLDSRGVRIIALPFLDCASQVPLPLGTQVGGVEARLRVRPLSSVTINCSATDALSLTIVHLDDVP